MAHLKQRDRSQQQGLALAAAPLVTISQKLRKTPREQLKRSSSEHEEEIISRLSSDRPFSFLVGMLSYRQVDIRLVSTGLYQ